MRHAIDAYHGAGLGHIARIYVAGGGADQFGLLRYWSEPNANQRGRTGWQRNAFDESSLTSAVSA